MAKMRVTLVNDFNEILTRCNIEACKKVFHKCDINATIGTYKTNAFGCTPLTSEFAFWLKEQGCDIEFKDNYEQTPIFHHVTKFMDDFDLMIALGANIFAIDQRGITLLHKTVCFDNLTAVKKLLDYGFDINVKLKKTYYHLIEYTPLEYAFIYGSLFPPDLLTLTEFMIENGALVTDELKKTLIKKGEDFQFRQDSFTDKNTLQSFADAYEKLYQIIGVEPPKQMIKHDGISDIIVCEADFIKTYNKLWEFLVPGSGRAKSAQGECIRLAGRLSYEIIDNGCMNWCNDFKLMANTLGEYFKIGNPLDREKLIIAEKIIKSINKQTQDNDVTTLSKLAVEWIMQNPKVLSLINAEYKR